MSSHTFRTVQLLCLFAVTSVSQSIVSAQEPSASLYERRLGILKGTSTGIVLYDFEKSQEAAVSAPTSAKSEAQTKSSAESVPQASSKSGFFSARQLPSGRSMSSASRLGAVDGGIPVPTARTASDFQVVPVAKP
jgi:hypothetical protein